MHPRPSLFLFFFFNDTATTEIYTLSLHDALPIWGAGIRRGGAPAPGGGTRGPLRPGRSPGHRKPGSHPSRATRRLDPDRKSTRLNSSHLVISYAVFCLKKKKKNYIRVRAVRESVE